MHIRRWISHCLNGLLFCIGLAGLGLLIWEIGWPLSLAQQAAVTDLMRIFLLGFIVSVLLRWGLAEHRKEFFRAHRAMLCIVFMGVLAFLLDLYLPSWLEGQYSQQLITRLVLVYISATQLFILAGISLQALPTLERHVFVRMSPGMLMIVTFLLLILVGTCLLQLPKATEGGISWVDAFFTSTSAVCVTGLIVVDTATAFTRTGQTIIMCLFQTGGLGIMTLTYFLAVLAGEGLSVRNRVQLSELMSEDHIASLGHVLMIILLTTFITESIGALGLAMLWGGNAHWFDAIFHSISAFCNAGFSTFTDNLADPLTAGSVPTHLLICFLIILGGLGYPVLRDLGAFIRRKATGPKREYSRGLSTHSRLVLSTTVILLCVGTVLGLWIEKGAGQGSFWSQLDVAFFNSVTARTAGFNITDLGQLLPAGALMMMVLMLVGGSPGSMAGGIKTTTFAVAFLNVSRLLRNRREIEVFNRRLPKDLVELAFATVLLALIWICAAGFVLLWMEPHLKPLDAFFEVFSAFGTVGVSRGITAELSTAAKLLLVLTMFVGRIGILTFTLALFRSRQYSPGRLPSDTVILN